MRTFHITIVKGYSQTTNRCCESSYSPRSTSKVTISWACIALVSISRRIQTRSPWGKAKLRLSVVKHARSYILLRLQYVASRANEGFIQMWCQKCIILTVIDLANFQMNLRVVCVCNNDIGRQFLNDIVLPYFDQYHFFKKMFNTSKQSLN